MRADGFAQAGEAVLLDASGPVRVADVPRPRRPALASVGEETWSRSAAVAASLALVAIVAAAFARWGVAGAVVPWDSKNHFYAMSRFLGDALHEGTLPLWNPYHFGGYPAVADPQSLLFSPSMVLFALIAPHASMGVFDAVVYAHLLVGGMGVLGLGRRWGWPVPAALLAAVVFALGGSAAARLQHTGMIISYSFFPLALWALEAALDRRSLRLAITAGGAAALVALGRDQVAYLLCLALAGFGLRHALRAPEALPYLRDRIGVIALALMTTVAITAVPILLTLQFLHGSNRPGIAYGVALEGSLDPVNLLTLFAPNAFGSLDRVYDYWGPGAATVTGNDWTDRSIDYLFAGTVPLVLLGWHGFAGGRAFGRGARFLTLLLILATFYAFGRHSPLFGWAFDWVPGVALYRRPADATFVLDVALALLAGHLLHRYIRDGLPRPSAGAAYATGLATLVGFAVLVGWSLGFARATGHLGATLASCLAPTILTGAVAATLWFGRMPGRRRCAAMILVAVTTAELVWFNAASPLNAEPASNYSAYAHMLPDQARGLAVLKREIAARTARGEHPRVEMLGLGGSWQNASMVFRLENTTGYNPLRIAAYEQAVGVGENATDPDLRTFPNTFRGYNSRLARLLGLDYLVLDRPIADLPRHIPRPRSTLLFAGDRFFVYRLSAGSVPRAFVATHVVAVGSDAAIENGALPDFAPGADALVDAADLPKLQNGTLLASSSAGAAPPAAVTGYRDDGVTVAVDVPAGGGLLVLHDLAYPGWTAAIDGRPATIVRADLLFRGVELPAGHHTVEFAFHPVSFANLRAAFAGLAGGRGK